MAVVVGAPNIDCPVKAAGCQFIDMVGNIGGKVSRNPVLTNQNLILFKPHLLTVEPERAVLFIGITLFRQKCNRVLYRAGFMQGALSEPHIVMNPIFSKILLQCGNILL